MTNKTTNSFIQVNDIVLRFKKDILLDHVSYQCEQGKINVSADSSVPMKGIFMSETRRLVKILILLRIRESSLKPRDLFLIIPAIVISKYWLLSTIVFHEKTLKTPCIR